MRRSKKIQHVASPLNSLTFIGILFIILSFYVKLRGVLCLDFYGEEKPLSFFKVKRKEGGFSLADSGQ